MYSTNKFLKNQYIKYTKDKDLLNLSREDFEAEKKVRIEEFKKTLKLDELNELFDKAITYKMEKNFEQMNVQIDKYRLEAIEGIDFPVYHVKPVNPNGKVILYLHGHDDLGIMGALTERYDKVRYHKMIPLKLANEGYDVFAPELLGYGEAHYKDFPKGSKLDCGCLINERFLSLLGFNLGGFRVYQAVKTLDFMEVFGKINDVTVFGISGGGMTSQHILPIDDRIKNGIIACYCNTYADSILAKEHCCCNYVPGLLRFGDSYQLLALAAPKKLFTVNGKYDRGFPMAGSQKAFTYLTELYKKLNVPQNYSCELIEGKHEINEDLIISWLKNNV